MVSTERILEVCVGPGPHELGDTDTNGVETVRLPAWFTVNLAVRVPAVNVTTAVRAAPVLVVTHRLGVAPSTPFGGLITHHAWFDEADQDP